MYLEEQNNIKLLLGKICILFIFERCVKKIIETNKDIEGKGKKVRVLYSLLKKSYNQDA